MSFDAIREVDASNQLDDVLALPDHLRDALFRIESARLEAREASGLVVCGMGGSAIGGDLARAALGDRVQRPMMVIRDYAIPVWTPPDRVVLCSSYSGNTEETLACFEAAEALGTRRVVATTGGTLGDAAREAGVPVIPLPGILQPRAAVGYMFAAAAEVAAISSVAQAIRTEIDDAAARLEESRDEVAARSAEIAGEIGDSIPVFYGCDLTIPVAYRWKTQTNENAKLHAFFHQVPEMDHNEMVGWDADRAGSFHAVFITDSDQHPRKRERIELTAKLIEQAGSSATVVETQGETRTERLLSAVHLGDLVSLQLAAHRGVDPGPVEVLDRLKDELGRP